MFDEHQENEINRQALFSDETQDYRYPEEPDAGETVTLRFRTAKNDVDRVFYIEEDKNIQAEMRKVSSDSLFDYYEYRMKADSQPQRYYFQVVKGSAVCYFNRLGAYSELLRISHYAGVSYAGVGKGRGHVPDLCGPLLQR